MKESLFLKSGAAIGNQTGGMAMVYTVTVVKKKYQCTGCKEIHELYDTQEKELGPNPTCQKTNTLSPLPLTTF